MNFLNTYKIDKNMEKRKSIIPHINDTVIKAIARTLMSTSGTDAIIDRGIADKLEIPAYNFGGQQMNQYITDVENELMNVTPRLKAELREKTDVIIDTYVQNLTKLVEKSKRIQNRMAAFMKIAEGCKKTDIDCFKTNATQYLHQQFDQGENPASLEDIFQGNIGSNHNIMLGINEALLEFPTKIYPGNCDATVKYDDWQTFRVPGCQQEIRELYVSGGLPRNLDKLPNLEQVSVSYFGGKIIPDNIKTPPSLKSIDGIDDSEDRARLQKMLKNVKIEW